MPSRPISWSPYWIARLKPSELAAAQAELKSAGFPNPTIRDFDDQPLDIKAIDKPIDVLMDLEPRSAGDAWAFPAAPTTSTRCIGPMLAQAVADGKPVASDPIPLLRQNGPIGLVLASRRFCRKAPPSPPASSRFPTSWRR